METEKPMTIGRAQSRDESSESPETFSPEMFEEEDPPDPSELEQIDVLEKVTKNYFIFLIATVHLIRVYFKAV